MRTLALVAALVLVVVALGGALPAQTSADSGSISRDARGPQPSGDYGPLGSPPSPQVYVLGQTAIFIVGLTLLVVAAGLGAYTLLLSRRMPTPR